MNEPMRLDAYYYSFYPTGEEMVDRVLSAVACAGKSYHHTDSWSEPNEAIVSQPFLRGESATEQIQNAAIDASATLSEVRADRDRLAAEVERLRKDVAYQHDINIRDEESCAEALASAHQDQLAAEQERDAAIAARDSAVAERDAARELHTLAVKDWREFIDANPGSWAARIAAVRGELFDAIKQRDSAVNDTAEAIADWVDRGCANLMDTPFGRTMTELASDIRAGAWRGQNGGG